MSVILARVWMCVLPLVLLCVSVYACTLCVYMYLCVFMYLYVCVCMYLCVYTCTCVSTCMCVCVYILLLCVSVLGFVLLHFGRTM